MTGKMPKILSASYGSISSYGDNNEDDDGNNSYNEDSTDEFDNKHINNNNNHHYQKPFFQSTIENRNKTSKINRTVTYSKVPLLIGVVFSISAILIFSSMKHYFDGNSIMNNSELFFQSILSSTSTSESSSSNLIITTSSSSLSSNNNNNDNNNNNQLSSNIKTIVSPETIELDVEFEFYRDGYVPLEIHHDYLYYSFLQNISTIIEPYAANYLIIKNYLRPLSSLNLFISSSSSSSSSSPSSSDSSSSSSSSTIDASTILQYKVCLTEHSGECSNVGIYNPINTTLSIPIVMACKAYDQLTLFISVDAPITTSTNTTTTTMNVNTYTYSVSGEIICMYVRRELRSLTISDRDKVLDAMFTMWDTTMTEEEGQKKYGQDYHNTNFLNEFHYFNAAWQEADHLHEGNGFLAQHIKITNIFEKSLQAVDKSVALPYWDFTIDSTKGLISELDLFTPEFFGSMKKPKNSKYGFTYAEDLIIDGAIQDGRWAFIKAQKNEKFKDLNYGYGYIRSPWNKNPSPYVSRFDSNMMIGDTLPSCTSHYQMLQKTDFMDYNYNMEFSAHATTHALIGGTYGCDLFIPLLTAGYLADEDSLLLLCTRFSSFQKEFYRGNLIHPNSNCTINNEDLQQSNCNYSCGDDENKKVLLLDIKNKMQHYLSASMTSRGWEVFLDFVCDGDGQKFFVGDHLESASASDPSFWVIHPTLDRLTHAKLMVGGFASLEWSENAIDEFVCNKPSCYSSETQKVDYYDICCQGHYPTDQLMDASVGNKNAYVFDTNENTMKSLNPASATDYTMPYIYDHFNWSHCGDLTQGNDFETLLESTYAITKSSLLQSSLTTATTTTTVDITTTTTMDEAE